MILKSKFFKLMRLMTIGCILSFGNQAYAEAPTGAQSVDSIMAAAKKSGNEAPLAGLTPAKIPSGYDLLKSIFGDVVDNPMSPSSSGEGNSTLLGNIFGVVNMSLMAIGILFLTYSITAGIAQTAHDGEFLGKRFSTLWVPMRLMGGVTMLAPVFQGWSIAQLLMVWLAMMGVGIANLATDEAAKYVEKNMSMVTKVDHAIPDASIADALIKMNLCVALLNKDKNVYNDLENTGKLTPPGWSYGDTSADFWNVKERRTKCGSILFPPLTADKPPGPEKDAYKAAVDVIKGEFPTANGLAKEFAGKVATAVTTTDPAKKEELIQKLEAAHIQARINIINSLTHAASFASTAYMSIISEGHSGDKEKVVSTLRASGFTSLGTFFSSLASSGASSYGAPVGVTVEKMPIEANQLDESDAEIYKEGMGILGDGKIQIRGEGDKKIEVDATPSVDETMKALIKKVNNSHKSPNGFCSYLFGLKEALSDEKCRNKDSLMLTLNSAGGDIFKDSVAGLVALDSLKTAAEAGIVGLGGGGLPSVIAIPVIWGFEAVKIAIEPMITLIQTAMFFGAMLLWYLPLLPYVAWLGAMLSWVVVVIEGVVAAPMWAFAHLDTEGEGMGNKAQHGYLFFFQLLFRPLLMVIGFITAVIVMEVMGTFFFATFPMALSDADVGEGKWDLVGKVVGIGVFFTTSVMLVNMSMNLIHLVPDTVLQWIGAQSQSASAGSQAGQDFTRSTAGAMAAGGQMASQAGQALKGKRAQDKADKDKKEGLARPKMNSDGSVSTANEDAEKHARNGNKATSPTVDITPKIGSVKS